MANGSFPGPAHSPYKISETEINGFMSELQKLGLDKAAASTAAAAEKIKMSVSSNGPANDWILVNPADVFLTRPPPLLWPERRVKITEDQFGGASLKAKPEIASVLDIRNRDTFWRKIVVVEIIAYVFPFFFSPKKSIEIKIYLEIGFGAIF